MAKDSKPFVFGVATSGENFTDREKETERLLRNFKNGVNTVLISPRRWGKTSLVRKAGSLAASAALKVVYLDIFSCRDERDFYNAFAAAVLRQTSSKLEEWLDDIRQFLSRLSPKVTFGTDPMTDFSLSLDLNPQSREVDEILDLPEKIARKKGCNIVVCIDEFQQIAEYQEKGTEALLRSYIQFLPNVNFIFAGSKQHLMHEMFMSSKRPFYQSTQLLTIGPVNREAYACFAIRHFAEHGVQLPREVFDTIYDKFDGHTWYIQCLLNRLYGYNQNVDKELVAYATEQIVSEQSYSYADLLKAYSAGHIRLLKAIAREGCVKEVLAGDFISRHRLRAASSVSASLKKLLDNELVYQTPCGYIIYDRFMNEWLRQQLF